MKLQAGFTLIVCNFMCIVAFPIIAVQFAARFMISTACCSSAQNVFLPRRSKRTISI